MRNDFFDQPIEQFEIVLIDKATIAQIEREITACQRCDRKAEIPLDWILDKITGHRGSTTDYLLETLAYCRCCGREVTEKTWWSGAGRIGIFRTFLFVCCTTGDLGEGLARSKC